MDKNFALGGKIFGSNLVQALLDGECFGGGVLEVLTTNHQIDAVFEVVCGAAVKVGILTASVLNAWIS